eukprot:jgi/Mesvir1/1774/Mv09623-RA.1
MANTNPALAPARDNRDSLRDSQARGQVARGHTRAEATGSKLVLAGSSYENSSSTFAECDYAVKPERWLEMMGHTYKTVEISKARGTHVLLQLAKQNFDVFINLCDGAADEDRAGIDVVAALERLNVAYTGADVCFYEPSREEMKLVAEANEVLTPAYRFVFGMDDEYPELLAAIEKGELTFPLIVKHYNSYGSIMMTKDCKVHNVVDLKDRCLRFLNEYGGCLVEQFIAGREFTVLVVETQEQGDAPSMAVDAPARSIYVYPPVECSFTGDRPADEFKHFDLKFVDSNGGIVWLPCTDEHINAQLIDASTRMFAGLHGRGYGRLDFRSDLNGNVYFLEVNPNCGCFYDPSSEIASADWILRFTNPADPEEGHRVFLQRIMDAALESHRRKQKLLVQDTLLTPLLLGSLSDAFLASTQEETGAGGAPGDNPPPPIMEAAAEVPVVDVVAAVRGVEQARPAKSWTMMVWTAVRNDLEIGAWRDLAKLTSHAASEDVAVHMLMETNEMGSWRLRLHGDASEGGSLTIVRRDPLLVDCIDMAMLTEFIAHAARVDPAERYMVVLQGHGFGWYMRVDDSGRCVPADALRDALTAANVPIDILGLDACCMATLEILESLGACAKTIVACEGYCPWDGIVSARILERLDNGADKTTLEVAQSILSDFLDQQPEDEEAVAAEDHGPPMPLAEGQPAPTGVAAPADMSLFDCSAVPELVELLQKVTLSAEHYVVDAAVDEINISNSFVENSRVSLQWHERQAAAAAQRVPGEAASCSEKAVERGILQTELQKRFAVLYDLHRVISCALEAAGDKALLAEFERVFDKVVRRQVCNKLYRKRYPTHRGMSFVRSYDAPIPRSQGVDLNILSAWSLRPERASLRAEPTPLLERPSILGGVRDAIEEKAKTGDWPEEVLTDVLNMVDEAVDAAKSAAIADAAQNCSASSSTTSMTD